MALLKYCQSQYTEGKRIGDTGSIGAKISKAQLLDSIIKTYAHLNDNRQRHANVQAWSKVGISPESLNKPENILEAIRRASELLTVVPVLDAAEENEEEFPLKVLITSLFCKSLRKFIYHQ